MSQLEEQTSRRLEQAVEALVFAAESPLSPRRVVDVFEDVTGESVPEEDVESAVKRLNVSYEEQGRALRIEEWAGGYRMATHQSAAPFLKSFFHEEGRTSLSRSLMETVAIVAYRQPVTKPEVDHVRGVDSGYALRKLMEMGLTEVVGRSESLGRPLLYGTTDLFLEQFGMNDLDDLPRLREIEELLDDPDFSKKKARMLLEEGMEERAAVSNGEAGSSSSENGEVEETA